jgi:leucine dehydrogenase
MNTPESPTPVDCSGGASLFERLAQTDHEQVIVAQNRETGLRGFLAIHDTTIGPAFGGVRIRPYANDTEALEDALRLSRAMTYKASLAGLPCGGGKTVLIEHPGLRREAAFESFGALVESLGGRYFCARDVGIQDADLTAMARATRFVARDPAPGLGDVSEHTAIGVWHSLRACLEAAEIRGKVRVAIQGVGSVGAKLAQILARAGMELLVADALEERAATVARETHARVLPAEEIAFSEAEVFAPCALGGVLSARTIPRLRCRVVCGCANNMLATQEDGDALSDRGILYAPDYLANAGGLIRGADYFVLGRLDSGPSLARIYDRTLEVIATARAQGISTARAADGLAAARLKPRKLFRDLAWRGELHPPVLTPFA